MERKGKEREILQWRNLTNYFKSKPRLISTEKSHGIVCIPVRMQWEGILPLWFLLKTTLSKSNYEKNIDKSQQRYFLQNIWPVILRTVKVIKNKESLRNCHNQEEEPKETQVPAKHNEVSWVGSWTDRGTFRKNWRNLNKVWTLVNNNVSGHPGDLVVKWWLLISAQSWFQAHDIEPHGQLCTQCSLLQILSSPSAPLPHMCILSF